MHPYLMARRQQFNPKRKPVAPDRLFQVLLALDGLGLTRELLVKALDRCVELTRRVDILLVNPSPEDAGLLLGLIGGMEQRDIETHLSCTEGTLEDEVNRYLQRFPGIKTVVTDNLTDWAVGMEPMMSAMRREGYRFVCLSNSTNSDQEDDHHVSSNPVHTTT